jgi:hypothetical protein
VPFLCLYPTSILGPFLFLGIVLLCLVHLGVFVALSFMAFPPTKLARQCYHPYLFCIYHHVLNLCTIRYIYNFPKIFVSGRLDAHAKVDSASACQYS